MTKEAIDRYMAAAHAMQTGVAHEINLDPDSAYITPKFLRVGVNSALVDSSAIAGLLMEKGIFTQDEYEEALAIAMERERDRYQAIISRLLGDKKVTLT
jgi:hypothetical protein